MLITTKLVFSRPGGNFGVCSAVCRTEEVETFLEMCNFDKVGNF